MNLKRAVKIIKNGKRKVRAKPLTSESTAGPTKWSMSVQSWVNEFQKRRRGESLTAFDRLFKQRLMMTGEKK